ncbi:MAG: glycosyltransferase family 4 protein [Candidatus Bathyarchaeia archaeon]
MSTQGHDPDFSANRTDILSIKQANDKGKSYGAMLIQKGTRGKKVVMLLSRHITYDQRVKKEATSLSSNGYKVKILVLGRKDERSAKDPDNDRFDVDITQLNTVSFSSSAVPYLLLFNLIIFIKTVKRDFDIVHCNDFDTLIAGFFAARIRRKKVVYDSHELYAAMAKSNVGPIFANVLYLIENFVSRRVDSLITVNSPIAEIFAKRGVGKEKISVVMNCKDAQEYKISSARVENLRKSWNAENKLIILYNGWLWPHQGLEELIASVGKLKNQIKDVLVVLCGSGSLEGKLKAMVETEGLEKYVRFVGPISLADNALYVNSCDFMFLLFKKTSENALVATPNRLFEAIISGKPVLTNNFGQIKNIVEENHIGVLVNPESVEELCSAILKLRNPKVRSQFCQNALKLSEIYNWSHEERNLLKAYDRLISEET